MKLRGLWKLPGGRDWLWVKLGLALVGKAMLSKSLIQFSSDGRAVSLPVVFPRPNHGVMVVMATSFRRLRPHGAPPRTAAISVPDPVAGLSQPTSPAETPGHAQASLDWSLVGLLLLSPGSWCTQGFVNTETR